MNVTNEKRKSIHTAVFKELMTLVVPCGPSSLFQNIRDVN